MTFIYIVNPINASTVQIPKMFHKWDKKKGYHYFYFCLENVNFRKVYTWK